MNPILEQAMRLRFQDFFETLSTKTSEHANLDDILYDLRKTAKSKAVSPEEILVSYSLKYFISIREMIDIKAKVPSPEKWNETMGCFVNSMFLLDFMMQERLEKEV
jgi:hypothetical protein